MNATDSDTTHRNATGPWRAQVTGSQFGAFLKATGYKPSDTYRFLKNWGGSRTCPPELAARPVVYVSQAEARAYCKWGGKRLPQEWEWQYAAQGPGNTGAAFPWGDATGDACASAAGGKACQPDKVVGNTAPPAPVVGQHSPQGDSPFGVQDLVGTVWQYTTEVFDAHSRSNMLRGGSNYMPGTNSTQGSHWYFPMVNQIDQHNHYRLMSDSYERAATVGFRCVRDVAPTPFTPRGATTGRHGGKASVAARWSGPPPAYTTLTTDDDATAHGATVFSRAGDERVPAVGAAAEWVRWLAVQFTPGAGNDTIHTVRSQPGPGGGAPGQRAIGELVCRGGAVRASNSDVATFRWSGAAPPDATANTSTEASAVLCSGGGGFELSVRASGDGPQTLALFGGLRDNTGGAVLRVTATISGGGTVSQSVVPGLHSGAGDTVHHVTFDGPAGALLDVLWSANATANAPAPAPASPGTARPGRRRVPPAGPYTYTLYAGSNCFHGQ